MSTTFVCNTWLATETCCACGIVFAMPNELNTRLRKNHESFYCPVGHSQHYLGETEEEKLKRQVAQLQSMIEHKDARIAADYQVEKTLRRSRAAIQGRLKSVNTRIKHGVCPCCKRTFSDLARHMQCKHPRFPSPADHVEA